VFVAWYKITEQLDIFFEIAGYSLDVLPFMCLNLATKQSDWNLCLQN